MFSKHSRGFRCLGMGLLLALAVAGCGGDKGLVQVKGQVVYADGKDPSVLAKGMVFFDPADPDAEIKVSARGRISDDGSFVMYTYKDGDGVHPGSYKVRVKPPQIMVPRDQDPPPELLDPKYRSFETTDIQLEVTGPMTDYTVTVKRP
jgi:hypothetical protein